MMNNALVKKNSCVKRTVEKKKNCQKIKRITNEEKEKFLYKPMNPLTQTKLKL